MDQFSYITLQQDASSFSDTARVKESSLGIIVYNVTKNTRSYMQNHVCYVSLKAEN